MTKILYLFIIQGKDVGVYVSEIYFESISEA